jgi:hypothetical protein
MKKLLKWTGIILTVLLLFLVAAPFLFKDKIVGKIKEAANSSLNATLDFKDVDLSLIRNFPNLSIRLEGLSVINKEPFDGDTLIRTNSLSVTLDIMSVISGDEISIRSVTVDGSVMNFLVDENGKANWDIAKPSPPGEPSEPSAFKASLKKYAIKDSRILYDDKSLGFHLLLEGVEHSGSGDFTQDLFTLSTSTTADAATMKYGGVPYISKARTAILADLDMDMKNFKFVFKDNKVTLNDLQLSVDGFVAMPDTNIDIDLKFATAQTDFKTILSMIPAVYAKDFASVEASGTMKLSAFLKGRYNAVSMPGFGLELGIADGRFKYPSLPAEVKGLAVDLSVNNPDGVPDHTAINLSRFHADVAGDVLDARLTLRTPVSDPDIDAMLKGRLDLGNVGKFYPLSQGTTLTGSLSADATMKGRMSAAEKQDFSGFTAAGTIRLQDMMYSSPDVPKPLSIRALELFLDPRVIRMNTLVMTVGKTDLKADGALENLLGYMVKDQSLRGRLNLLSSAVDLNEWMTGTSDSAVADTSAMSVVEIPGNIDFTLSSAIGRLVYGDYDIRNVKGTIVVRDRALLLNGVSLDMLGGNIAMSGSYETRNPKSPGIDFSLDVKGLDIQQTVKSIAAVGKMAPLAKHCSGSFGTSMTLKGTLDKTMSPVLNSLSGSGKLSTTAIVISGFPAFVKVADLLKMPEWKQLTVPSMNPSFTFMEGRVYIDPFDLTVNGYKTQLAGSNGFDQSMDYNMNVDFPRSKLGAGANSAINSLVAAANAKGASVSVGDVIPVSIGIKGTVTDPKITTDLNRQGAKAMDALKDAAKAEFERQKAAAEAKAREEADKLKAEAASRMEAEKAKAKEEAERLKKEAEAKAKAAADEAKKKAQDEAKKQLKNLNPLKK